MCAINYKRVLSERAERESSLVARGYPGFGFHRETQTPAVHWSNERSTAAPIARNPRDEVEALARLARTEVKRPTSPMVSAAEKARARTLC